MATKPAVLSGHIWYLSIHVAAHTDHPLFGIAGNLLGMKRFGGYAVGLPALLAEDEDTYLHGRKVSPQPHEQILYYLMQSPHSESCGSSHRPDCSYAQQIHLMSEFSDCSKIIESSVSFHQHEISNFNGHLTVEFYSMVTILERIVSWFKARNLFRSHILNPTIGISPIL